MSEELFAIEEVSLAVDKKYSISDMVKQAVNIDYSGEKVVNRKGRDAIRNLIYTETKCDIKHVTKYPFWDWSLKNKDGRLTKRISKLLYKEFNYKATAELLTRIGNYAEEHTYKSINYDIWLPKISRLYRDYGDLWNDGDFADEGSCFWACRAGNRQLLSDIGAYAALFYRAGSTFPPQEYVYANGLGRAWLLPFQIVKVLRNNIPELKTTKGLEHGFIMFNLYSKDDVGTGLNNPNEGNLGRASQVSYYDVANLFTRMFEGWNWFKHLMQNEGSDTDQLWINAHGYFIGPEYILDKVEKYIDEDDPFELEINTEDYRESNKEYDYRCAVCDDGYCEDDSTSHDVVSRYDEEITICDHCYDAGDYVMPIDAPRNYYREYNRHLLHYSSEENQYYIGKNEGDTHYYCSSCSDYFGMGESCNCEIEEGE